MPILPRHDLLESYFGGRDVKEDFSPLFIENSTGNYSDVATSVSSENTGRDSLASPDELSMLDCWMGSSPNQPLYYYATGITPIPSILSEANTHGKTRISIASNPENDQHHDAGIQGDRIDPQKIVRLPKPCYFISVDWQ